MNLLDRFKQIRAFVFDVDGVLTDGTVLVLTAGLLARRMHIKDGFALQMAIRQGYLVKIISGGNSPEVTDAGKTHIDELVKEVVHPLPSQRHHAADFLAFSQSEA